MDEKDRRLGMGAEITRRDFVGGVGIAVGASLLPGCSGSVEESASPLSEYYPPGLTGMRGSHAGSFEVAHAVVQGRQWTAESFGEEYDLVVVGAGISGLASAYIYRRDVDPNARILILDNHDDFGGHAKRNEFSIDNRTLIGFGGTMFIESALSYPANAARVLDELGIDATTHEQSHHSSFYESHGMGPATFFDATTFGADYLAKGSFRSGNVDLDSAPISDEGKADFSRYFADEVDYLEGRTTAEKLEILRSHSYREYLEKFGDFGEELLAFVQKRTHGVWAIGADALPAWMGYGENYPGFGDMRLEADYEEDGEAQASGPRVFHFPDGNASVARLLARKLVPSVAPGNDMNDVVTARFDYGQLDLPENSTRIRLNSTAVGIAHLDGDLSQAVDVTYVNQGKSSTVTASKVIWAGYHSLVPHICPDLSQEQGTALSHTIRVPLVYTNVLIRNWQSLKKVGMQRAYCPGSFFQSVMADFAVSMGDYKFSAGPDEPIVLHLQHIPTEPGLPPIQQFLSGRRQLLETSFETFERNVRDQLGRMLAPGGFDPARDIAAITVNRWPHGYAYSTDPESGEVAWYPDQWLNSYKPWEVARQRLGNIGFAGTDSASNAMTEAAIEEAYRAVHDLAGGAV